MNNDQIEVLINSLKEKVLFMMQNNRIHLVKKSIREQENYSIDQTEYRIKLNQNENPYPLAAELKERIMEQWGTADWNRYPQVSADRLRRIIAEKLNLAPENIVTANGSNEILRTIFSSLLGSGEKVVMVAPSFSLYSMYGNIFGAEVEILNMEENLNFPVQKIVEKSQDPRTVLTVLCSPNNPTGNTIDFADAVRILEAARGFVLIDEAYIDFCDQDFSGLSRQFSNLILIRTFSKAFSFACGRCGFGIASADLVNQLYKLLPPYNLNGFVQTAAGILFQNKDLIEPVIEKIIEERNRMERLFSQNSGLYTYASEANFILIKPFTEVTTVMKTLQNKSILVRDVSSYPGLSNHLRITVGKPEENDEVMGIFQEMIGS
ncbi:MAG: histidinol-phosphate transaminase [bacterium]